MIYDFPYYRRFYNGSYPNPYNKYKPNIVEKNTAPSTKHSNLSKEENDDFIINILGINLYFDDLLIIGLLYLLYKQDIKDLNLYIVLILLLLN